MNTHCKQWRLFSVWMEAFLFASRYFSHPIVSQSEVASPVHKKSHHKASSSQSLQFKSWIQTEPNTHYSLIEFRRAHDGNGLG